MSKNTAGAGANPLQAARASLNNAATRPSSVLPGTPTPSKVACSRFEGQPWRPTVCKNCFKNKTDHVTSSPTESAPPAAAPASTASNEPPKNTPSTAGSRGSIGNLEELEKEPAPGRRLSSNSGETRPQSLESPRETQPTKNEPEKSVPAKTGNAAIAASASAANTGPASSTSPAAKELQPAQSAEDKKSGSKRQDDASKPVRLDVEAYVRELEDDLFDLEDKCALLQSEKKQLEDSVSQKSKLTEQLEKKIQDYKTKIGTLERRCTSLESEVDEHRQKLKRASCSSSSFSKSSSQSSLHKFASTPAASTPTAETGSSFLVEKQSTPTPEQSNGSAETQKFVELLEESRRQCDELSDENEGLRDEIEYLQRQIEEMSDKFHEDELDLCRQLQHELEATAKTCRLLQFKLRKTERRLEECETERSANEEQVKRLQEQLLSNDDKALIQQLEDELRLTKDMSNRLHEEIDFLQEKRARAESDNQRMRDEFRQSESRRIHLEAEVERLKLEIDRLRSDSVRNLSGTATVSGPLQVDGSSSLYGNVRSFSGRTISIEQLNTERELQISKEREADLQEQLHFAEEEVRMLKRKLNDVDEENEALASQLRHLNKVPSGDKKMLEALGDEFVSQELAILKRRVVSLQQENDLLNNELKGMRVKLKAAAAAKLVEETRASSGSLAHSQTDLDRRASSSMSELASGKSGGRLQKSKSLDCGPTDLTKQLEAANTELRLLKEKVDIVQNENDRLQKDNNRLILLLARKGTSTVNLDEKTRFLMQDNQDLRSKLAKFDDRLDSLVKQVANFAQNESQTTANSKEIGEKLLEYVSSLRDKLKSAEASTHDLQKQVNELEEENQKLCSESQKLKNQINDSALGTTKRGPHAQREDLANASREELLDEVYDLENEVSELLLLVKKGDQKVAKLEAELRSYRDDIHSKKAEFDAREKELLEYVHQLLVIHDQYRSFMDVLTERADVQQFDLDRVFQQFERQQAIARKEGSDSKQKSSAEETETKEKEDDDVFSPGPASKLNASIDEALRMKVQLLTKQLDEAKFHNKLLEKQVEVHRGAISTAVSASHGVSYTRTSSTMMKELEQTRREHEEKDRRIGEQKREILDLKQRLEQTKRLYEATKLLIDKPSEPNASGMGLGQKGKSSILSGSMSLSSGSMSGSFTHLSADDKSKMNDMRNKIQELEDSNFEMNEANRTLTKTLQEKENFVRAQESLISELNKQYNDIACDYEKANQRCEALESRLTQMQDRYLFIQKQNDDLVELKQELEKQIVSNENRAKMASEDLKRVEAKFTDLEASKQVADNAVVEKTTLYEYVNNKLNAREQELAKLELLLAEAHKKIADRDGELVKLRAELKSKTDEVASTEKTDVEKKRLLLNLQEKTIELHKLEKRVRELESDKNVTSASTATATAASKPSAGTNAVEVRDKAATIAAVMQQQQSVEIQRLNLQVLNYKLQLDTVSKQLADYINKIKQTKETHMKERHEWSLERARLQPKGGKEESDWKSTVLQLRETLQQTSLKLAEEEKRSASLEAQCRELGGAKSASLSQIASPKVEEPKQSKPPPKVFRFLSSTSAKAAPILTAGGLNSAASSEQLTAQERVQFQKQLKALEDEHRRLSDEKAKVTQTVVEKHRQELVALHTVTQQLEKENKMLCRKLSELERSDPKVYANLESQHQAQEMYEQKQEWLEERSQLTRQIERYRSDITQFVASIRHISEELKQLSTLAQSDVDEIQITETLRVNVMSIAEAVARFCVELEELMRPERDDSIAAFNSGNRRAVFGSVQDTASETGSTESITGLLSKSLYGSSDLIATLPRSILPSHRRKVSDSLLSGSLTLPTYMSASSTVLSNGETNGRLNDNSQSMNSSSGVSQSQGGVGSSSSAYLRSFSSTDLSPSTSSSLKTGSLIQMMHMEPSRAVRKITKYPDPPAGFVIMNSSRKNSTTSLDKVESQPSIVIGTNNVATPTVSTQISSDLSSSTQSVSAQSNTGGGIRAGLILSRIESLKAENTSKPSGAQTAPTTVTKQPSLAKAPSTSSSTGPTTTTTTATAGAKATTTSGLANKSQSETKISPLVIGQQAGNNTSQLKSNGSDSANVSQSTVATSSSSVTHPDVTPASVKPSLKLMHSQSLQQGTPPILSPTGSLSGNGAASSPQTPLGMSKKSVKFDVVAPPKQPDSADSKNPGSDNSNQISTNNPQPVSTSTAVTTSTSSSVSSSSANTAKTGTVSVTVAPTAATTTTVNVSSSKPATGVATASPVKAKVAAFSGGIKFFRR